jgi:hypothetical protein
MTRIFRLGLSNIRKTQKKNHEDKFWLTKMLSDEIEKESFNKKRIQNKTNGIQ